MLNRQIRTGNNTSKKKGPIQIVDIDTDGNYSSSSRSVVMMKGDLESTPYSKNERMTNAPVSQIEDLITSPQYNFENMKSGVKEEAVIGVLNKFEMQEETQSVELINMSYEHTGSFTYDEEGGSKTDENRNGLQHQNTGQHGNLGSIESKASMKFAHEIEEEEAERNRQFKLTNNQINGQLKQTKTTVSNFTLGHQASINEEKQNSNHDSHPSNKLGNEDLTKMKTTNYQRQAEDYDKNSLGRNMAIDISHDSADIDESPSKNSFDDEADIIDSQGNQQIPTEEDKNDFEMKKGKNRGRSHATVHLSNHYNNQQKVSQQLGHFAAKRQKTRLESKAERNDDQDVDEDMDYDELMLAVAQDQQAKKMSQARIGQEQSPIRHSLHEPAQNDDQNNSIDMIMNNLSMNRSISKIGQKPYLMESDSKVYAHALPQNENPFLNISPSKEKVRRHTRKSHKKIPEKVDMEQIKLEYIAHLRKQSRLSVAALQKHIVATHPKKIDEESGEHRNWSICENMGSLLNCGCCVKRKIHKVNKNVGLGASLYLLSLKAYIYLFLVLSILAIPSVMILTSGNEVTNSGSGESTMSQLFSKATLGNIGYLGQSSCQYMNLAQNLTQSLDMRCPSGVFSKITAVGLNRFVDQDVCNASQHNRVEVVDNNGLVLTHPIEQAKQIAAGDANTFKSFINFDPACSTFLDHDMKNSNDTTIQDPSYYDMKNSTFMTQFMLQFNDKCKGNATCNIDNLSMEQFNSRCGDQIMKRAYASKYQKLQNQFDSNSPSILKFDYLNAIAGQKDTIPEPLLYFVGWCKQEKFLVKFTNIELTTEQLALSLTVSDIIILSALILGYNMIYYMQKDYSEQYDNQVIEARDFTLVIDQLPDSFAQHKDELSLKFAIWQMIQQKISLCKQQNFCHKQLDETIVEINFGSADIEMLEKQSRIGQLIEKIENDHIMLTNAGHIKSRFKSNEIVTMAKTQAIKNASELQEHVDILKLKYKDKLGLRDDEVVAANEQELQEIDELKVQKKAKDFVENVKQVYVTFASMQTKNLVERLFYTKDYSKIMRLSEAFKRNKKLNPATEENKEQKIGSLEDHTGSLYIIENPNPEQIYFVEDFKDKADDEFNCKNIKCEPDIIIWKNMSVSWKTILCRKFMSFGIMNAILCFTMFFLYLFTSEYLNKDFNKNSPFFKDNYSCDGTQNDTMQTAWENTQKSKALYSQETMTCFCRNQFSNNFTGFVSINFTEYGLLQSLASNPSSTPTTVDPSAASNTNSSATSNRRLQGEAETMDPCREWLNVQVYKQASAYGPSIIVVIMNGLIGLPLMIKSSEWERHKSKDQEQFIRFLLIVTCWFINTVFVLIFFQQAITGNSFFDAKWYVTTSSTLAFVFSQLFVPFVTQGFVYYIWKQMIRHKDRGLQLSLFKETDVKKIDETNEDLVATQLNTQRQLYTMYTGPQFDAGLVHSQVIVVLFICLFFSGTMPLFYPLIFGYLVLMYWYSKFMLLKFCQKSQIFNEHLVLDSYKTMKFAVILHLMMTFFMFKGSAMLSNTETEEVSLSNKINKIGATGNANIDQAINVITDQPTYIATYITFFTLIGAFYIINLIFVNPVSVFCQVGTCIKRKTVHRKKSRELKNKRIQKYIDDAENQSQDPNGDNLDTMSVGTTLSKASSPGTPSRQSVLQFAFDKDNTENNHLSLKGTKMISNNYFNEISFDSLRFQYSNIIASINQSNRRMNLYFRVAGVNKNSKMGNIFLEKYNLYQTYHNQLLSVKLQIEKVIHYYWNYVKENVDIEIGSADNRSSNVRGGSMYYRGSSVFRGAQSEKPGYFSNAEGNFAIRVSKIPGVEDEELGQVEPKEMDMDYKDINKRINAFQRQNTKQIVDQETMEEYELRQSCMLFFKMLDYLDMNFDEEWLRTNYLPKRLRCMSYVQSYNIYDSREFFDAYGNNWLLRAEMILKNPFIVVDEFMMTEELITEKQKMEDVKENSRTGYFGQPVINVTNEDAGAQEKKLIQNGPKGLEIVTEFDQTNDMEKKAEFIEKQLSADKLEDSDANLLREGTIIIEDKTNLEIQPNSSDNKEDTDSDGDAAIIEDNAIGIQNKIDEQNANANNYMSGNHMKYLSGQGQQQALDKVLSPKIIDQKQSALEKQMFSNPSQMDKSGYIQE